TVKSAWRMSSVVEEMASLDELLKQADFVTFHVPLIDATLDLLNAENIANMKDDAVILNFARHGVVNDDAALAALEMGKLKAYICDFPAEKLKRNERVITLPHLGASTFEAEENCAMMVADQIKDFLQNGNIKNSVNFPEVSLPRGGQSRVALTHKNMPDMIAKISTTVGDAGYNIFHMRNESRNDLAYTLMDIESEVGEDLIEKFVAIDGVLKARKI
ncbi:3-phosphoglycerate dehydrogenase, partial [Cardiobacterium sp. AH-315-I02]|nr:3-phosphoglycerate dehydrogenase [Cardiobacterium sp. AH-315-I02]